MDTEKLLRDFFEKDDTDKLTRDAGETLGCPLLVINDTFRVIAHFSPSGFRDELFEKAVRHGEITYEAGAIISKSTALSSGEPDFVELIGSNHRRRFAPLISDGVRYGYLVCVDVGGILDSVDGETFSTVEAVLAKQLFVEESRIDKPFETAEEILMHLLGGGFPSAAYFRLQASSTYLADFHPAEFALIDLSAYRSLYSGKNQLKDELTYHFYNSHPFIYNGAVFMFLQKGYDVSAFFELADEFHLKIVISEPIGDLFELPEMYRSVRDGLTVAVQGNCRGNVFPITALNTAVMLTKLAKHPEFVNPSIRRLAAYDKEKSAQYCETLYHYLVHNRSLKETGEAMFTHRNTVLYRIRRIRDEFGISIDDPDLHLGLLLSVSILILNIQGADFFIDDKENQSAR